MATIIISFVIGLITGAFGGLIGIGGGLIMIPLMVEVLKLSQHKAHGTSLVALVLRDLAEQLPMLQMEQLIFKPPPF